jgi:hypothetical protein
MKPLRKFYPDLQACELEARLLPVIANLGVIVLTTGGYILMIPSRGLPLRLAGRHCHPHIVLHDGSGGISSIQPGNITGVPSLAATGTTGASGGAVATITVGSGPMMPPPRASLWSLATRSPTTPRMLPPSSAGRPGIDPPSCPPVSSIGATSRRPRPHHPRRKRLANGRAGLRAGVLSIRPRFG